MNRTIKNKGLLLFIFACLSYNLLFATEDPTPKAKLNETLLQRAAEFKRILKTDQGYRSGVYIYTKRSIDDYLTTPEVLAARLALLGFTDIYLGSEKALSGKSDDYLKWQKTFIEESHLYGMKVHALRLSSARLFVDDLQVLDDCKLAIDYNYSVKKKQRFDGVSADLEPHILKKGFVDYPKGLTLYWDSKNNFGKGKDNDLLLKRTVDVMKMAQKELKPLPLSQAMGFFFQPRVDNGLLEHGGAKEFLQYCDQLIVMAYNFKAERVFEMAKPLLVAASEKEKAVSICVKTSLGTVGDEGPITSFQTHGWDYMLTALQYLMNESSQFTSFRGLDIFEFQGFEFMWKDDEKN